jgi:hypothetical protein
MLRHIDLASDPIHRSKTKIVQGWPKLWANFQALIGIFSQIVGPSLTIWVNPDTFRLWAADLYSGQFFLRCGGGDGGE